jgi:hypothetical protein
MIRAIVLAALLAGCAARPIPTIPAELQSCPKGTKAPPAPPQPRTVESLAQWSIGIELAREATGRALGACADNLARVIEIVDHH